MGARFSLLLLPLLAHLSIAQAPVTPLPAAEVRSKAAHLREVVRELEGRDVSRLTPAQRAARARCLERLRAYADEGRFIVNDRFPGRSMPYFIDGNGTRCALGSVIESSGGADLLRHLAEDANNAWVSQLLEDRTLGEWLESHGLTADEVAYIQGPGWGRPPSIILPGYAGPNGVVTPRGPSVRPNDPTPRVPAPASGGTPAPGRPTPAAGAATAGRTADRRNRSAGEGAELDWATWWSLRREDFVNVRARYHDALPATGARASRPRRPSPEQVRYVIFPLLERVAAEEPDLAATCLMGLARIAGPTAAGRALDRILAHLGDPGAKHREYDLLALGVLGHPGGLEPLRDVLLDRPAGRKLLGKSGPPPIAWRALAAIALGKGGAGSEDLIRALEREAGGNLDLRASCVAALGLAGRDPEHRGRVGAVLLRMLREEEGPATLRAQVPLALAQAMDRSSVAELLETVRRFRGPREVRQSCVVALGLLASDFGRDVVEALLVAARRDPDHAVRPLAVLAIAELAHRNATGPDEAGRTRLLEETALFFEDGISGFHRQDADRPWYALGAGLFARAHPRFADRLGRELSALARGDGDEDARAAATLALGLAPGNGHRKALRGLLDAASPKLRGAAIEAVGIAGDREAEPRLVALCQSPDDWIAHQAAIGLATLAGPRALPVLVAALERTSSEPVRAALTRAIGELGDKEVLPELARIALDRGLGLAARERALAALGLLGQDADRPWTADLRRAGNLAAATPTLQMVTALF